MAPGNSAGTLSVGSLTLAGTSALDFELGAPNLGNSPSSDRVDVAGNLVLDGTLNISALTGFGTPQAGDRWRLFNYGTGLTDHGLELGTVPGLGTSGLLYFIDLSTFGQVNLAVGSAVPEPSSVALLALGLLGFTLLVRLGKEREKSFPR